MAVKSVIKDRYVGNALAKARQARHMSQRDVMVRMADLVVRDEAGAPVTLTDAAISRLENTNRLPGYRTLQALAAAYHAEIVVRPKECEIRLLTGWTW